MAYYRLLRAPEAMLNGSGNVKNDIEGLDSGGNVVPGKHADFVLAGSDLETWSAMPDETGTERVLKNTAYKDLLLAAAPLGWTEEDLNEDNANNQLSVDMASAVDEYITVDLGQTYPADFQI